MNIKTISFYTSVKGKTWNNWNLKKLLVVKFWKRLLQLVLEGQLDLSLRKQLKKLFLDFSKSEIIKKLSLLKIDKVCKQIVKNFLQERSLGPWNKVSKRLPKFTFFSRIELMKGDEVKIWKRLLEIVFGMTAWCEIE